MGFDTYWFDDKDDVSNFNFENCIFLTIGTQENRIPLNKSSFYILHHIKNMEKYISTGVNYINLGNYLSGCDIGISVNHPENNVIKMEGECCFWDEKTKTLYQPWATDLTPDEIFLDFAMKYNPNNTNINFVGTISENYNQIKTFENSLPKNISFNLIKNKSDDENFQSIRNSLISIDIRNDWHVECGYLPCRIFKNISYFRLTGTNSPNVKKIFGDYVIFEPNLKELYIRMIEEEKRVSIEHLKKSISYVKNNHTYINRINNILKFIM